MYRQKQARLLFSTSLHYSTIKCIYQQDNPLKMSVILVQLLLSFVPEGLRPNPVLMQGFDFKWKSLIHLITFYKCLFSSYPNSKIRYASGEIK